ncbi:MAG TPA: PEP-CTERM sorting domain-containing protein [Phycisphaerae bacterium]|nr:PEP-CTERM sorting domain-containing protein [Phycisphaerae bacterium]
MQSLGGGIAYGVSADGSVIAGYSGSGSASQAFRWTAQTGRVALGYFPGSPQQFSRAYGVSGDGTLVLGSAARSTIDDDPVTWTPDTGYVSLGNVPGGHDGKGEAWDSSTDGSVIVGNTFGPLYEQAFIWRNETGMSLLSGQPDDFLAQTASAVSSDGTVVVGWGAPLSSLGSLEAYRWTSGGGVQRLGDLPQGDFESIARDVSGDGSLVVGQSVTGQYSIDFEAFIWDANYGMRNLRDVLVNDFGLDLSGWRLIDAWGISSDGNTIVGYGTNPSGFQESWRAVIPEPAALSLAALGLLLSSLRRRRTRARR